MGDEGGDLPYKTLMGMSGAVAVGSAGVLAIANGHLEGLEYVDQAHAALPTDALFMNPELGDGADSLYEHVVGNIDTASHFLSGAAVSGAVNKILDPDDRTKAVAAGLASGALGYTMLKEGMYEGAYNAIDLSVNSLQNAAAGGIDSLAEHVYDELGDVNYNPDQWRDAQADTAGVLTERTLASSPSAAADTPDSTGEPAQSYDELVAEDTGEELSAADDVLEPSESGPDEAAAAYDDGEAAYAEA